MKLQNSNLSYINTCHNSDKSNKNNRGNKSNKKSPFHPISNYHLHNLPEQLILTFQMNARLMSFGSAYAQRTIFSALNSNMALTF